MSSVAFGALATRREQSDSGTSKSEQPPGLNTYIDVLAALVPAEVLAINALIIAAVTKTIPPGQTQITDQTTLRWAFWLLLGLSAALFVTGRRPVPTPAVVQQQSGVTVPRVRNWEWQDLIRLLIPPAAFVGWAMIEPTSVWNAVAPAMSSGMRLLIPTVGAVLLAAVTKALATHSDKKASPAQMSERSALVQAVQRAVADKAKLAEQLRAQQAQSSPVAAAAPQAASDQPTQPPAQPRPAEGPSPAALSVVPDDISAEYLQSVPKWIYSGSGTPDRTLRVDGDRQRRGHRVIPPTTGVSEEVLLLARCVGSEAATKGFIVLTGGTVKSQEPLKPQESPKAVKDAALKGVEDAVSKGAASGDWIGVLQEGNCPGSKRDGNCAGFKPEDKGGVIYSDMGNQRNFLEACLCDAAIVLEGAEGTISEAVSALCLGKPVLLCRRTPTEDRSATYQVSDAQKALFNARKALYQLFETQRITEDQKSDLVKVTRDRLKEVKYENPTMQRLIQENVHPDNVRFPERSCLIPTNDPEACQDIASWLAELTNLSRTG
jgi:predicted Rossmann-fold nucleotide-binding protein